MEVYYQTRRFTTINDLVVYAADTLTVRNVILRTPANYAKHHNLTRQAVYNRVHRGTLPVLVCPDLCLIMDALDPLPDDPMLKMCRPKTLER